MFGGPPRVAVPTVLPGFQSLLFILLRLSFQTVMCCVQGTWSEP